MHLSQFNISDSLVEKIITGILSTLGVGIISYFFSRFKYFNKFIWKFYSKKERTSRVIEAYRKNLIEKSLKINHPWMKETQTLDDILVPINFIMNDKSERYELEAFIKRAFETKPFARILILGEAGNGKTVAMKVLAKAIWSVRTNNKIVPVLMNFSDIKNVKNVFDLKRKLVEKLMFYQYGEIAQSKISEKTIIDYVEENLLEGNILLLIDGFDELEKEKRKEVSGFLNTFLGTYYRIPAVFSSRTSVYEYQPVFDGLINISKIFMAPFHSFAILKFVSQWNFEGKKSSRELIQLINGKAHLAELASNPLMLTIITFLYSLPKYNLPDNRVDFYEACNRALLEEWDRAKNADRANKFRSHQKIAVLSRIAFEQIVSGNTTDEYIHESRIYELAKEEMRKMSLKVEEYTHMIDEIVQNSGLLSHIPPYDFRFPHRTFMEYFAANYINTQKSHTDLLQLYVDDPGKWKQSLLLYCGLNKNKRVSDEILIYLKNEFINTIKNNNKLTTTVFSALMESSVPHPDIANEILDMAKYYFRNNEPIVEIIEDIGLIAANPRLEYSVKAKQILLSLLNKKISSECFEEILLYLVLSHDDNLDTIILSNLRQSNLVTFFSRVGRKREFFLDYLLKLNLSEDERKNIVEGLRDSGNFQILGSMLLESKDKYIKMLSATALASMTKINGFFTFLDELQISLLNKETSLILDKKYQEWGWQWDFPKKETGKKAAILICYFSAEYIYRQYLNNIKIEFTHVNNWFKYLVNSFLVEKGIRFNDYNLVGFNNDGIFATPQALKKYWKYRIDKIPPTLKFSKDFTDSLTFISMTTPFIINSILGTIGYIFYNIHYIDNELYINAMNSFSANFFFFYLVTCRILSIRFKDRDILKFRTRPLTTSSASIWMNFLIAHLLIGKSKKYRHYTLKLSQLLLLGFFIISIFLPIHYFLKTLLLISLFFQIILYHDDAQISFPIIYTENALKIRDFLRIPIKKIRY